MNKFYSCVKGFAFISISQEILKRLDLQFACLEERGGVTLWPDASMSDNYSVRFQIYVNNFSDPRTTHTLSLSPCR